MGCIVLTFMAICHWSLLKPKISHLGYASKSGFSLQVFMVARDNGTTYNGLASSCTPVSRLASVASGCPTTAFADCDQVRPHTTLLAWHTIPCHALCLLLTVCVETHC